MGVIISQVGIMNWIALIQDPWTYVSLYVFVIIVGGIPCVYYRNMKNARPGRNKNYDGEWDYLEIYLGTTVALVFSPILMAIWVYGGLGLAAG